MQILTVGSDDAERIEQMAALLVMGFREIAPDSWETLDEALESVHEVLDRGFCRAALDDSGAVIGWIGGLPEYDGHVWELHPLIVSPKQQGQGIGQALIQDFEYEVRARGGLTIILGSDDQTNMTTLSQVDLYDDLPGKIAAARGSRPHPLEFYRGLGYTIVGVVPDANGRGRPDIILGKRV